MTKLKMISKYSILILVVIVIFTLLYTNIFTFKSRYKGNERELKVYVREIKTNYYIVKGKEELVLYYRGNKKLKYNDYILVKGYFSKPRDNTNFNTYNYRKYLEGRKIYYVFNAYNIKIIKKNRNIFYEFKNTINNRINKFKSKKYLKLFILGDKGYINKEEKDIYRNLGIIHLFSISGTYISIVILFLNKILRFKSKNIIICIILLLYILLTGFQISIIRSSICYILFLINKKYKLEIENKDIVILLASFLLLINPYYLYDIGFLLSFIISYSLIKFSYLLVDKNYITKSIIISSICFFTSLPIVLNSYYSINLLGIIYNLIFVPFVSFILFPLSFITYFFPVFDNVYSLLIKVFENMSIFFDNIKILNLSFSKIPIIIFYFNNYYLLNPRVYFFDVGQGDCSLIRIKNRNILIDTGGNYKYDDINNYYESMKSVGVKKIDYLIITHGDYDHIGEAINLVNNFKVEKVIFNCGEFNDLEKELIKVLDKKKIKYYSCIKELNIDSNKLYFLQTKEYDNENDNSNIIYTELDGYKFMFMGDAGIDKEKDILDKYNLSNIDVLKVGHHGSKTSSSKDFIDEINPKYSIISVGKNNRYGHPNKEVLSNLDGSKIFRTDQDGSIMLKIKNNKLKIETCSP